MEDYYEYLDSNGVTTLYKLIKDDTVALIDSYSVTVNGITTTLDTHINNSDIHTPIADIENMVDTKISGLVNSAPETLDTLKELSDALGNDPNFATTVANQIGNKASKDSVYTKEETTTLLEGKANSVHSHVVSDITDFPTIPTKVSELSNDSNFVTSTELHDYATKNDLNSKQDALSEEQLSNIDSIPDKANKSDLSTVATSGSYKDLLDKPVIPEGADLSDYYNKGETDNLLNSKANTSDLAVVAKSGNYNDLVDTPTIPSKTSDLTNDSGYITNVSWEDVTSKPELSQVAVSGSYSDLSGTPTIPTKTSQLINDSGFLTSSSGVITSVSWSDIKDKPSFSTVATSGSYTDLSNTPTIPTKLSDLSNDSGFAIDNNAVHKTGNETISGTKIFTDNICKKDSTLDLQVNPSSDQYNSFLFTDKNNVVMGYLEHVQTTTGVSVLGLIARDKNNGFHGIQVTSEDNVIPLGNGVVNLGLSGAKWKSVYATTYYGNLVGGITLNQATLKMTVKDSNSETTRTNDVLLAKSSNTSYGINVAFGGSGNTVVGAGESYTAQLNELAGNSQENLFLTADNNIYFKPGANTFANAKTVTLNSSAELSGLAKVTSTSFVGALTGNVTGNCSGSSGSCTGNAASATKASYLDNYSAANANKIYLDWDNQVKGYVGLKVDNTTMGGLITTKNIGSQAANSATYATTQATTDNSTKIATTAWVRTYVNSVAGSNTVGSSVSAYWSNSSNVTATGQTSAGGTYPACYSEYITKTPTVGTIYSGAQLYTKLAPYASATASTTGQGGSIKVTNITAQATFSNPISSTGKYLCTTANTVKFRAYVTAGNSSTVGSASVVDNSSTKSIFIRIE